MRPPRWVGGRCDAGHDVTDPTNVAITTKGRACRECRRATKRMHAQRRAELERRPVRMRWKDGRCGHGHDVTAAGAVYVSPSGSRECILCRAASNKASRARIAQAAPVVQEQTRDRHLTPGEIEAILDLRQRAETAPAWERADLIARAERIRVRGFPRQADPTLTLDARAANRRKLLAAKLVARRDGGADAVDGAAEPLRDGRDGGAVGTGNEAGAQRSQRAAADADGPGHVFEGNAGPVEVDQGVEVRMGHAAGA